MARKPKANVSTSNRSGDHTKCRVESIANDESYRRAGPMLAWLVALLISRWLIPTEAAAQGMTLWIVQLVLLTAVGRIAWLWRTGESINRIDGIDASIGLLVAGQVVSALCVVFTVGNQRGAINLAWEWIGSGVLIWLIRQELKSARIVREVCLGLTLTGAMLAGYGMYQHYVWYPQMVREYDRMISKVNELTTSKGGDETRTLTASESQRLAQLQSEMSRQGIPLDESARKMWDSRLKGSSEPLGLFALANSFAGLLLVLVLVALESVMGVRGTRANNRGRPNGADREAEPTLNTRFRNVPLWLFVAVIGFCLILSKCRTAMCGLVAGFFWWGCRWLIERRTVPISKGAIIRLSLVGAVIFGTAIGAAALSGGLDIKVLSESSKSLRYRLEFWQGTWSTIREHIWFGTGPANFRDYYLAHKLPESSEEIADPHNMILDVWANAGLLGLSGLVACVMLMVRTWTTHQCDHEVSDDVRQKQSEHRLTSAAVWGAGLAFPLAAIGTEFLGFGLDERLWWLGGIWWLIWLGQVVWERQTQESDRLVQVRPTAIAYALEAANIALLVHLLGAGGIAMPAIIQLLLLVWILRSALSDSNQEVAIESTKSESPNLADSNSSGKLDGETSSSRSFGKYVWTEPVAIGVLGAAILASGLCLLTGTLPELTCRTALELGDTAWLEHRNFEVAIANYAKAAAADRFSLEPLERTASLSIPLANQTQKVADYEEADRHQQALIDRLPFSPHPYRSQGQLWLTRFEKTQHPSDAVRAVTAFDAAVKRYPHHAGLLSEWALSLKGAGQVGNAQAAALRALAQDDVNHRAEHSDKYLDGKTRKRLELIASPMLDMAN